MSFNYASNKEFDSIAGERYSSNTGPFYGLSLILNLEQRYYIGDGITQAAGARFVTHFVNHRHSDSFDEFCY